MRCRRARKRKEKRQAVRSFAPLLSTALLYCGECARSFAGAGSPEKRGQRQLIACADRPGKPCDTTAETLAAGRHSVSAGRPRGLSAASPRRGGSRRHHKHQPRPHRCRRPLHLAAHGYTTTARPQQRTPAVALTRGLASNITYR
ncbi:hypothetical protein MTO96_014029 [Rhipicephalus appendiculatus]